MGWRVSGEGVTLRLGGAERLGGGGGTGHPESGL